MKTKESYTKHAQNKSGKLATFKILKFYKRDNPLLIKKEL